MSGHTTNKKIVATSKKYGRLILNFRNWRTFLLLGDSGGGKSETINNILRKNICKVGHSIHSETNECEEYHLKFKCEQRDCLFKIIDTPGRDDTVIERKEENWLKIRDFIKDKYIDYTFVCYSFANRRLQIEDFISEVSRYLNGHEHNFMESCTSKCDGVNQVRWDNLVVIITHAASLRGFDYDDTFGGPQNYSKKKDRFTRQIRQTFKRLVGTAPPIIFMENNKDFVLQKDGFDVLPDGKSWLKEFWEQVILSNKQMDVVGAKMFTSAFLHDKDESEFSSPEKIILEEPMIDLKDPEAKKQILSQLQSFAESNAESSFDEVDETSALLKNASEKLRVRRTEMTLKSPTFSTFSGLSQTFSEEDETFINLDNAIDIGSDQTSVGGSDQTSVGGSDHAPSVGGSDQTLVGGSDQTLVGGSDHAPSVGGSDQTLVGGSDHAPSANESESEDESSSFNLPRTEQETDYIRNANTKQSNNLKTIGGAIAGIGACVAGAGTIGIMIAGGIAAAPFVAPLAVGAGIIALIGGGITALFG
jgi:predicted GTPase